jgi:hypothetical protein
MIVVTSPAALELWTNVADDYRFFRHDLAIAASATAVTFFTERAPLSGQQAVAVLTDIFSHHSVPPLRPGQEHHLGAVLACHDVPKGEDVFARVTAAEQIPMGASTTPEFEDDVLAPLLARYHRVRERGANATTLALLAGEIRDALAPVVLRMLATTEEAVARIRRANLPPLPEVDAWVADEWRAFARFRQHVDKGGRIPRRDGAGRAVRELTRREARAEMLAASLACHDTFGRFRAVWLGEALEGRVIATQRASASGTARARVILEIATDQPNLRLRRGDDVAGRDVAAYTGNVVDVTRDLATGGLRVRVRLAGGSRVPGPPAVGSVIAFVRGRPDPYRGHRTLRNISPKLQNLSWMQQPGAIPPARSRGTVSADPLAALEVFR